jgi:Flp pilus assembly protein CpaB
MLLAALLAVLVNYAALRARDDTTRVAVVASELRGGQVLTAGDLAYADLRADDALLATLLSPEAVSGVEGWVVTSELAAGELVRTSDLQSPSAPSGQRAMSIPIATEHAVAGDLRPGDRVDVIEVDGRSASYLVTDAEVLAVPAATSSGIAGALSAFSVTVAVDDEVALRLAVAIRAGQLELVRSTGSTRATADPIEAEAAGRAADGGGEG